MIAAGGEHSMVLVSGKVYCWGNNEYGQCNVPKGLSGVKAIDAGYYHLWL